MKYVNETRQVKKKGPKEWKLKTGVRGEPLCISLSARQQPRMEDSFVTRTQKQWNTTFASVRNGFIAVTKPNIYVCI